MPDRTQNRRAAGYLAILPAGTAVRTVAWVSMILAFAAMVVGHLGAQELVWSRNNISTFAARAPNGDWITAAMLFVAVAMLGIGILAVCREGLLGKLPGGLVAMAMGAAGSGLLLLAAYEETAAGLSALRKLGFAAIRQQSFHDAGLLIFFYGTIIALLVAGAAILGRRRGRTRLAGAAVFASGPLSYLAMTSTWPATLGLAGVDLGLKQRSAFLLLWVGALVLLAILSRPRPGAAD